MQESDSKSIPIDKSPQGLCRGSDSRFPLFTHTVNKIAVWVFFIWVTMRELDKNPFLSEEII